MSQTMVHSNCRSECNIHRNNYSAHKSVYYTIIIIIIILIIYNNNNNNNTHNIQ